MIETKFTRTQLNVNIKQVASNNNIEKIWILTREVCNNCRATSTRRAVFDEKSSLQREEQSSTRRADFNEKSSLQREEQSSTRRAVFNEKSSLQREEQSSTNLQFVLLLLHESRYRNIWRYSIISRKWWIVLITISNHKPIPTRYRLPNPNTCVLKLGRTNPWSDRRSA